MILTESQLEVTNRKIPKGQVTIDALGRMKVGNGRTPYNNLPFAASSPGTVGAPGPPGRNGTPGAPGSNGAGISPADQAKLDDLSGVNTGDQDLSGLVPVTRTVNGHALSGNVTVTASDVGAPSGSGTSSGANTGDQSLAGLVPTTRQVNGHALSADVTVTKSDVGLSNVDNTSDAGKPVSTAHQTALDLKAPLASPAFTGTPTGITKTHVGLGNADNTSDAAKPVSTAAQTALDLKAPLASPAFTGTPTGITKTHVGLGNVDNTTDAGKPVSTAQQTALDLKANIASPTFTGTVGGITKSMVGLGSVDNTADAGKPVSTVQQTALDLKATAGSAITSVTEASSTPVTDTADQVSTVATLRLWSFFTLPATEKWYVITGIEWKNGATVTGATISGVAMVDASPPVAVSVATVAWGASVTNAGASSIQRNNLVSSTPIRGGTTLGVWIQASGTTHTYRVATVASANNRKTVSAGAALEEGSAWGANTAQAYVKAYYIGYK